jgi:hypothetical protein
MEGSGFAATRLKFGPARKLRNRIQQSPLTVIPAKAGIQTRCLGCWRESRRIFIAFICYRPPSNDPPNQPASRHPEPISKAKHWCGFFCKSGWEGACMLSAVGKAEMQDQNPVSPMISAYWSEFDQTSHGYLDYLATVAPKHFGFLRMVKYQKQPQITYLIFVGSRRFLLSSSSSKCTPSALSQFWR